MIVLERLKIKNLLSIGNKPIVYEFKPGLTRISGASGSGKNALIVDSLNYALFGKPYRKIKLRQLVNSINKKELLVELEFTKKQVKYKVVRGMKPNVFKIYKNNKLVDISAHNKDYQKILEDDILGLNEELFNHLTVKSLTKRVSFMTATKSEKREIIEKLFGLEIISLMKDELRQIIHASEETLQDTKNKLSKTEALIESEERHLRELKEQQDKLSKQNNKIIENHKKSIESDMKILKKYTTRQKTIKSYTDKIKNFYNKIQTLTKLKNTLENKLKKLEGQVELKASITSEFESICGNCPKVSLLVARQLKSSENIDSTLETIKSRFNKVQALLSNYEKTTEMLKKVLDELPVLEKNIKSLKESIVRAKKNIEYLKKASSISVDRTKLDEYLRDKEQLTKAYNRVSKELRSLYFIRDNVLSDTGLKLYLVKRYLPFINELLNKYLTEFDLSINIYLDNEFKEHIYSRFKEDFSYFNFSEGEKKRIDLAILFAFLEFSDLKNRENNLNVLVLDEIASGLDNKSENILYNMLKKYNEDKNKEIIVMSHAFIDFELFDRVIDVKIEKGFSEVIETRV